MNDEGVNSFRFGDTLLHFERKRGELTAYTRLLSLFLLLIRVREEVRGDYGIACTEITVRNSLMPWIQLQLPGLYFSEI